LGSTLLRFGGDWGALLAGGLAPLKEALAAHGCARGRLDERFDAAYARNVARFFAPGQHDWIQISGAQVLRVTCEELGLPPPGEAAVAAALAAVLGPGEALYEPYPGAHAVLETLRAQGLRLALVSNASDEAHVQRLIDRGELRGYFDPILVSAARGLRKPNPRLFRLVAELWWLPAAEIAVVGDMLGADILGAQLAGMPAIWARMDADNPANAAHAGHIVPDAEIRELAELPGLLAGL
jgi:putative hydrolase of the HAD superfamily